MRIIILFTSLILCVLTSCASRNYPGKEPSLISLQTVDKNGFSETISNKDRVQRFAQTDFLSAQPYQKVLRVYERDKSGTSASKITSYHSNGYIQQYLEIVEGRAHGAYKEWHPNGTLKIDAQVIEGVGDVSEAAQLSWVFEGENSVWDEQGNAVAVFQYSKGMLEGTAIYYHPNGQVAKSVPYHKDLIEGEMLCFDEKGNILEKIPFTQGQKHGVAEGKDLTSTWSYKEEYELGCLQHGAYSCAVFSSLPTVANGEGFQAVFDKGLLISLIEIHKGKPEGSVRLFHPNGSLKSICHIHEGKKHGEEREFYSSEPLKDPLSFPPKTKVLVFWHEDILQGLTKTWYENGSIESEREMNQNHLHGVCSAYYKNGNLMLMEEYNNGKLIKGTYFKKGDKLPVSRVDNGSGIATIFHGDGHFIRKTNYEKGRPAL